MKKEKQYPIVKYRLVDGFGYSVCETWEDVLANIRKVRNNPNLRDKPACQPKYIVKVTEERLEVPENVQE